MGHPGLRRKTDCLAGFCQRTRQIVAVGQRNRQIQMGRGQIRRQCYHLPKERDPFAQLAHLRLRFANRGQRGGILRRERDGFVQFLLGVRYPALLGKNQPEFRWPSLYFGSSSSA